MPPETYYSWFEVGEIDGKKRLLTPHSDPFEYEYAIDFMFKTQEEAISGLEEWDVKDEAIENNWVLCEIVCKPVKVMNESDS